MPIDINKNYDIVRIIDIPENEISDELKQAIKAEPRYKDADQSEHIYNASQILESMDFEQDLIMELEAIDTLCGKNQAIYFRITES